MSNAGKAHQLFGDQLPKLLDELNEVLAARTSVVQSQRDCGPQPRVARNELPWVAKSNSSPTPTGLCRSFVTGGRNPVGGLDLSELTYVPEHIHREIYKRCNVEKGDVLCIKRGDLDDFVGCYFGKSGGGVPPLNQEQRQSRDGSATLSENTHQQNRRGQRTRQHFLTIPS